MNAFQHRSNNAVLAPPQGVSPEECAPLPITRLKFSGGAPGVASFWQPTAEEIERIRAGAAVQLVFIGQTHPPVSVQVDGDPTWQL